MMRDPVHYGLSPLWVYCADDGGSCMAPSAADLYTGGSGGGFMWPSAGSGLSEPTVCDMSTESMGFDFHGLIWASDAAPYACFYLPRPLISSPSSGPDPYDDMTTTCTVSPCVIVHEFANNPLSLSVESAVAIGGATLLVMAVAFVLRLIRKSLESSVSSTSESD